MSDHNSEGPREEPAADPSVFIVEGGGDHDDTIPGGVHTETTGDVPVFHVDLETDESTPLSMYHELCRKNSLPILTSVSEAIEIFCKTQTDNAVLRIRGDKQEHDDKLSDVQCLLLCRALKASSESLELIDLSCNPIKDDGCTAIASLITRKTRSIRLRGCLLSKNGAFKIFEAIKDSQCELKELDLSDNAIGTDAGVAIAKWLLSVSSQNSVSDDHEPDISKPGLRRLSLDSCDLGYDAIHAIINMMDPLRADGRPVCLERLDISNPRLENHINSLLLFEHMGHMLLHNTTLKSLHLGRMRIKDDALEILMDVLSRNPLNQISVLDLRSNHIRWKGIRALTKFINSGCCKVTHLNLEANGMGEMMETSEIQQLCHAVAQPHCGIVALNLNRNSLCGEAICIFIQCIRDSKARLKTVLWFWNDWDETAEKLFYQSLELPELESLRTDILMQGIHNDDRSSVLHRVFNSSITWTDDL